MARITIDGVDQIIAAPNRAVLVRLVLPIAMVVALHLFLRGHNQPGGGFVAGLVLATAFIAQYMVSGTEWVEQRLDLNPPWWIAAGLLIVVATGLGSLAFGFPFLTTHTVHLTLPVLGELHLPTAALFDTGVFAVGQAFFAALATLDSPSLTEGVRILAARGHAKVVDCSDLDWLDVDDAPAFAHAEGWMTRLAA